MPADIGATLTAMAAATAIAWSRRSEAGTVRVAMPIAAASAPSKVRPVNRRPAATAPPTRCGKVQWDMQSGMTPRRTWATAYFASAAMIRMSAWSAIVSPMPIACPFTAAMTGVRSSNAAGSMGDAVNSARSDAAAKGCAGAAKSTPAQNVSPAPVSTIARTSSSSSHRR